MKLTLSNVKEIKRNSDSPLTKRVCNYVIGRWSDYNDKKYIFTDVLHNGCCSGVVSELIYYYDTVRFYKQYRQEINEMLYNIMNETGLYTPSELFGDKWDNGSLIMSPKSAPIRIPISTISKPAKISAWICPKRRTVSRTTSNAGTTSA